MKRNKGFSLLEMLIVVEIMAIIAAIAIPSYTRYVVRAQRVEARNALLSVAQLIDQNYRITRDYRKLADGSALDDTKISEWKLQYIPSNSEKRYEISFVPNSITANGYILQAKAVALQAERDKDCAYFLYNQSGSQLASKSSTVPSLSTLPSSRDQTSIECWSK